MRPDDNELNRQLREVETAYLSVESVCRTFHISKDRYCRDWLFNVYGTTAAYDTPPEPAAAAKPPRQSRRVA